MGNPHPPRAPKRLPLQLPAWLVVMAYLSKYDSMERTRFAQTAFGISLALNMPSSSVYRAIETLEREGFVEHVNESPEGKGKGVASVAANGYPPRPFVLTYQGRKKLLEYYDILLFKRPYFLPDALKD